MLIGNAVLLPGTIQCRIFLTRLFTHRTYISLRIGFDIWNTLSARVAVYGRILKPLTSGTCSTFIRKSLNGSINVQTWSNKNRLKAIACRPVCVHECVWKRFQQPKAHTVILVMHFNCNSNIQMKCNQVYWFNYLIHSGLVRKLLVIGKTCLPTRFMDSEKWVRISSDFHGSLRSGRNRAKSRDNYCVWSRLRLDFAPICGTVKKLSSFFEHFDFQRMSVKSSLGHFFFQLDDITHPGGFGCNWFSEIRAWWLHNQWIFSLGIIL